jgi:hypothetical protein
MVFKRKVVLRTTFSFFKQFGKGHFPFNLEVSFKSNIYFDFYNKKITFYLYLLFQFILGVLGEKADPSLRSGATQIPRNLSKGEQVSSKQLST